MRKAPASDLTTSWIPELTPEEVAVFLACGERVSIKSNAVLMRQGLPQDTLYLLLSGELEATASTHRQRLTLGRITAGESVGEMSIIDPFLASATIRALTRCELWKCERADFERMIEEKPVLGTKVLRHLARTMARRVRRTSEHLVHQADAVYYDWD